MPRDLPLGVACKACPATVHWVKDRLGKNVPLETEPQPDGEYLVRQDPTGYLAVAFNPEFHGSGEKRYRSHLRRCRPSLPGAPPPQRPDPTAELKFPRRPVQLGWSRPAGLDRVDEFVRALTPGGGWRTSSHG